MRFEGENGWFWLNRGTLRASDQALLDTPLSENAERLYKSDDHMANFFECVRSRKLPVADVEIGHRSATVCHLGAIALRTGLKLQWNPQAEEFTGPHAKAASAYLARKMRKPYDYSFV